MVILSLFLYSNGTIYSTVNSMSFRSNSTVPTTPTTWLKHGIKFKQHILKQILVKLKNTVIHVKKVLNEHIFTVCASNPMPNVLFEAREV